MNFFLNTSLEHELAGDGSEFSSKNIDDTEDELEETSTTIGVVLRSFGFLFAGDVLEPPYTATDMSPSGSAVFDIMTNPSNVSVVVK